MAHLSFLTAIESIGIEKSCILLVSSNILRLFKSMRDNEGLSDLNLLIDKLQALVGEDGTLLFPTYNWDFCKGLPFDYYKTPSMTGALSKVALKRKDFKRTKHPIYSFAVWGRYKESLCSLENTDSFGAGSPFDFLYTHHGKNLIIDVDYQDSLTFLHLVEETVGVTYRYIKHFSARYTDEKGESEERSYSMFVRDLERETKNNINPIGEVFEERGVAKRNLINDIPFVLLDFYSAFDIIKDDILNNSSKKLVVYRGQ